MAILSEVQGSGGTLQVQRSPIYRIMEMSRVSKLLHQEREDIFMNNPRYRTLPSKPAVPTCEPFDFLDPSTDLPPLPVIVCKNRKTGLVQSGEAAEAHLPEAVQNARRYYRLAPVPFEQTEFTSHLLVRNIVEMLAIIREATEELQMTGGNGISEAQQPKAGDETYSDVNWKDLKRSELIAESAQLTCS